MSIACGINAGFRLVYSPRGHFRGDKGAILYAGWKDDVGLQPRSWQRHAGPFTDLQLHGRTAVLPWSDLNRQVICHARHTVRYLSPRWNCLCTFCTNVPLFYQVRNLQAIQRHVTLVLLSYFTLILLKILQWIKDKKISLDLSIRALALQVRRQILIERITVKLNNLKIQFKQNILDTYLEQLWA